MKKCIAYLVIFATAFALVTPAQAAVYDIQKELGLYTYLNQNTIPSPLAPYMCGPVAVVNSYGYLENKYPWIYGHALIPDANGDTVYQDWFDLQTVALTLTTPAYMNTTIPNGTFHDDLIWGKQLYLEQQVPGVTVYKAQDHWAWNNQFRPKPAWVLPQWPTWNFLFSELVHCEDVEILFSWSGGGHFVTLSSFHWNDINNDGVIDITEGAMIDFVNPWNGLAENSPIWQTEAGGAIEAGYAPGAWISMAVSESPVPEPSSIVLMVLGVLALLRWRRS